MNASPWFVGVEARMQRQTTKCARVYMRLPTAAQHL